MGTDIFAFIEVDDRFTGYLHTRCFAQLDMRRDYTLWNILFAVRDAPSDGLPPLAHPPRGFPARCSAVLAPRATTHVGATADTECVTSWLTCAEMIVLRERCTALGHTNEELDAVIATMQALDARASYDAGQPISAEPSRFVFWFSP